MSRFRDNLKCPEIGTLILQEKNFKLLYKQSFYMRKTTQQQSHTFVVANDDIAQLYLHASVVLKNKHQVIALANDGKELIELANKHKPDFILSDLIMPKKHGIEACMQIKNVLPKTKCIISSSYHDISLFYKTAFYKLNGFLFNDITPHKLHICMQQINLHNQFYIFPVRREPKNSW